MTDAVLADAAEVVAAEVDQHHVLGPLLGVVDQALGEAAVLLLVCAARVGAGDRPRLDPVAADLDQRLRRGAGDLEVAELEEVHVGRGVDRAQAAVDREGLDRRRRREALRGDDLEGVAGVDVLDDPRDRGFELLALHVGGEARAARRRAARAGTGTAPRRRSRISAIVAAARS